MAYRERQNNKEEKRQRLMERETDRNGHKLDKL